MKTNLILLLSILLYSCSNIIKSERKEIYNTTNGEKIYLKYCLYESNHEATMISLDSVFKNPDDSINEYIAYYDNPLFFYKMTNDTLCIYCYGIFQKPKNYLQFKSKIKMIDAEDIVDWNKIKNNYEKMGYSVFPVCNFR